MGLRLVPKSVTLNDLKRRRPIMAVILRHSTEFSSFGANYIKEIEDSSHTVCSRNVVQIIKFLKQYMTCGDIRGSF